MSKEKPILFSTPMVKAIIEGRKTQTRRVIRPQPDMDGGIIENGILNRYFPGSIELDMNNPIKSPYGIGDILWVRETWKCVYHDAGLNLYKVEYFDGSRKEFSFDKNSDKFFSFASKDGKGWQPSIYMHYEAARIFLKVTSVRVERLQDITDKEAIAEGIYEVRKNGWYYCDPSTTKTPNCSLAVKPKQAFIWLWDQINEKRGYSWLSNPWVWVYEFMRVK
jgi:hypothetical protein